tara:strand:+ start:236 stop:703 length:468 start_codon:yes stop_codon:yes gene_type:complete
MFGYNTISIDKKHRFSIPAKYRNDFQKSNESKVVVTKDPQYPSLKLYKGSDWELISSKLQSLQGLDPIVRNIQWTILGNANVTDFDPNERMLILLPEDLRHYAQIDQANRISFIGMGNKFEIWNTDNWNLRQTGGSLATEVLDVVLPSSIKEMSF